MPDEPLSTAWPLAPTPCPLPPAHVHVHRVALDRPDAEVRALAGVLAVDERERAARQRRPRDGARWMVARAALREVLASYVGGGASDVAFVVDDLGKPRLAATLADVSPGLSFNLSHSDGLALIAVARGCRVGVDIEAARGRDGLDAIAARYFSPRERAYLASRTPAARVEAFFVLWTAKEAYTKALGAGLSAGFAGFDVVVGEDGGLMLGDVRARPAPPLPGVDRAAEPHADPWTLRRLDVGPGYHAAVAVDDPAPILTCWHWPDTPPTP